MKICDEDEQGVYVVVINDEGYYSIWPQDFAIPEGWRSEGTSGVKNDCLAHIEQVWCQDPPVLTCAKKDSPA